MLSKGRYVSLSGSLDGHATNSSGVVQPSAARIVHPRPSGRGIQMLAFVKAFAILARHSPLCLLSPVVRFGCSAPALSGAALPLVSPRGVRRFG